MNANATRLVLRDAKKKKKKKPGTRTRFWCGRALRGCMTAWLRHWEAALTPLPPDNGSASIYLPFCPTGSWATSSRDTRHNNAFARTDRSGANFFKLSLKLTKVEFSKKSATCPVFLQLADVPYVNRNHPRVMHSLTKISIFFVVLGIVFGYKFCCVSVERPPDFLAQKLGGCYPWVTTVHCIDWRQMLLLGAFENKH